MRLIKRGMVSVAVLCAAAVAVADVDVFKELEANNVVWDSPSKDEFGSMPLGNGVTALNVWAVACKLYAIDRTVVEIQYFDGKLKVKTTPASRMKDVILPKWAGGE